MQGETLWSAYSVTPTLANGPFWGLARAAGANEFCCYSTAP